MFRGNPLCGAIGFGALLLSASEAAAQDADGGVRLVFGIEYSIEVGDNLALTVPSEGSSTVAATTLSFGFSSQTAVESLDFFGSAALLIEDTPDTDGTEADVARPELRFSYVREVPNALFGVDIGFESDDVDRLSDDLDDSDAVGTLTEYGIALRFETGRTTPASFFVEAAYDVEEYEDTVDPDLTDTQTTTLATGTRLRFSEVMTGIVAVTFSREDEEGDDATDTVGVSFGLDYALSNGSASFLITQSAEDDGENRTTLEVGRSLELPSGSLAARVGVTRSDLGETDLIGGLDWTRTLPDGEITFALSRTSTYDSDTAETTVETDVGLDWRHDINPISSLVFDVSWAESDSPSERVEEAEIGAAYSRSLNADWRLSSGIRYEVRNDNDGRSESPFAFVALGRSFDLRP